MFLQLHARLQSEDKRGAIVNVILLPIVAAQMCASRIAQGDMPASSASFFPAFSPLLLCANKPSRLRLCFCASWAEAMAAASLCDIRALFVADVKTYLGQGSDQQLYAAALPRMLASLSPKVAQFPPRSWEDFIEHKDVVFADFGDDFMLPSLWLPFPPLTDAASVAASDQMQQLLHYINTRGGGLQY